MNGWTREENPDCYEQIHAFLGFIHGNHNGEMDVDGFVQSEYGQELLRRLRLRSRYEQEPVGEETLAYYRSLGLKKEIFQAERYFDRWVLFTPIRQREGRRYPLMIWNHGGDNSIESEEYLLGFTEIAAKEGFLFCMAQNTNEEKTMELIGEIRQRCSVDEGRIYLGGFSQGAVQVHSTYMRHPGTFAACMTTGNDIYRPHDNFNRLYTPEEFAETKKCVVPLLQIAGACEPFWYAPLNDWRPITWNPAGVPEGFDDPSPDSFRHPDRDPQKDPTKLPPEKVLADGRRMAKMYEPEPGADIQAWALERVNRRMELQGCPPRDAKVCIGYRRHPEDELHYAAGIYGDYEAVERYYGYRHYTVEVSSFQRMPVYRWVVVENHCHWPPLTTGRLGWDYMKQFRRRRDTGELERGFSNEETDHPHRRRGVYGCLQHRRF